MKGDLRLLHCNRPTDVGMWIVDMLGCWSSKALENGDWGEGKL